MNAEGERAAEERFRTVRIGEPEKKVISTLGPPTAVVTRAEDGQLSVEVRAESGERRQLLDERDRGSWPQELRFLPSRKIEGKVLVYVEGTVFAYYFIDGGGRVGFLDVSMS